MSLERLQSSARRKPSRGEEQSASFGETSRWDVGWDTRFHTPSRERFFGKGKKKNHETLSGARRNIDKRDELLARKSPPFDYDCDCRGIFARRERKSSLGLRDRKDWRLAKQSSLFAYAQLLLQKISPDASPRRFSSTTSQLSYKRCNKNSPWKRLFYPPWIHSSRQNPLVRISSLCGSRSGQNQRSRRHRSDIGMIIEVTDSAVFAQLHLVTIFGNVTLTIATG